MESRSYNEIKITKEKITLKILYWPQKCSYPPRKIISKGKPRMSANNPRPPSPIKKSNPRNLRPRSRTTVSTDYSGVVFHGFFFISFWSERVAFGSINEKAV